MKRNFIIFIAIICILFLSSCFSPWQESEMGTFTIQIGDGFGGRANLPWDNNVAIDDLVHTITLTGGPGPEQSIKGIKAGPTIQFTVIPGTWTIYVEAFLEEANAGGTLMTEGSETEKTTVMAVGTATVEINPGQNRPVEIRMRQPNGSGDGGGDGPGNGIPGDYLLTIDILSGKRALSPIDHTANFEVSVTGFRQDEDADDVELNIEITGIIGLTIIGNNSGTVSGNEKTFSITIDDSSGISHNAGNLTITIGLTNIPEGYKAESFEKTIFTGCGTTPNNPIPVTQENIEEFNEHAREDGRHSHYRLVENIILTGPNNWTAIGGSNNPFTGSFDGGNFTITGLTINQLGVDNQGMFGVIERDSGDLNSGLIKNIGLIGGNITGGSNTGGIVGYNQGGTIENSFSENNVTGNNGVGGLVGLNEGTIIGSYSNGNVSGTGESIGGVVGENFRIVQNSFFDGNVNGWMNIGGVVGNNTGSVRNSYSKGYVDGSGSNIGGVVGRNNSNAGIVENCYSTTSIMTGASNVGGVVGNNLGIVRNNVALNPLVIGDGFIGRVVGNNNTATLISNYGHVTGSFSNIGLNERDGDDVTVEQALNPSWWTNATNWNTTNNGTPWTFDTSSPWYPPSNGFLPRLRNMPGGAAAQNPVP